jgi:hypothetical protein
MTLNKFIGGERELKFNPNSIAYTDSGRSSLRLILSSCVIKSIAVPNFLCDIIPTVLNEFDIKLFFYNINIDLSIDVKTIKSNVDAIYVINYFGVEHEDINEFKTKIIIEDFVFSAIVSNTKSYPKWYGFNSFRKISNCVEGSLVISNQSINTAVIQEIPAPFIQYMYEGKAIKYDFTISKEASLEVQYLNLFKEAEKVLQIQSAIHTPSAKGYYQICTFLSEYDIEKSIRSENYNSLKQMFLPSQYIELITEFKSFFILTVENRDSIKSNLTKSNVFLPIHWISEMTRNELEKKVLSIPLDSRYNSKDMIRIGNLINSLI